MLLRVEWLKLRAFKPFWLLLGLYPVVLFGFMAIGLRAYNAVLAKGGGVVTTTVLSSPPFAFPGVWQTVTYLASYFHFFPCVLVLLSICNEFQFRTHRQNLLDGWSRAQFLGAKLLVTWLVTLYCVACVAGLGLLFGCYTGSSLSSAGGQFLAFFLLQSLVYNSFSLWLGFLLQKGLLAVAGFFVYSNMVEPIASSLSGTRLPKANYFWPLSSVNHLIGFPLNSEVTRRLSLEAPSNGVLVAVGIAYLIFFVGTSWLLYRRSDL